MTTQHPRRRAKALLVALAAAGLAGCQGVPVGHYRYRASREPVEFALGVLALPFAFAGDVLLSWLVLADPFSWTDYSLALISPFHNAIDMGEPEAVPGLPGSVRATRSQWVGDFDGPPERVVAQARAVLARQGWTLDEHQHADGDKACTAWRIDAGQSAPLVARRMHVSIVGPSEEDPSLVTVRVRYELGGPVHGLIPDASYAANEARISALHTAAEDAKDDLEDEEPSVDLITYHSMSSRGEERVQDELEARRSVHRRRMESALDDALELEDEVFRARAEATRAALRAHGDDAVPAFWAALEDALAGR